MATLHRRREIDAAVLLVATAVWAVLLLGGCVQPDAVRMAADVPVLSPTTGDIASPHAGDVASPKLAVAASQPNEQAIRDLTAAINAQADRDNRVLSIAGNQVNGSAWALLAGLAIGGVVLVLLVAIRQRARARTAEARAATHRANCLAVGRAVNQMGPGPQRDRLLTSVRTNLCCTASTPSPPNRQVFDDLLSGDGVLVWRSNDWWAGERGK